MKRNWQKLAALALAFALALALALPAWADPAPLNILENATGTIQVTGAEAGVTVNVYRLMTVNFDTDNQQPEEPVYTWVEPVATWLKGNDTYKSYINADNNAVTDQFNNTVNATTIAAFYDALAAAIRGNTITLTATSGTADQHGSCTISNLVMGNYLVLIEGGMNIYRPSAVNLVPEWDETNGWTMSTPATVELKSSGATVSKSVNKATVAIGDSVNFTLTADVPKFPANATAKGYTISDRLPAGLTLDTGSIQVYGGDANSQTTELAENTHYTLTTSNATRPTGEGDDENVDFALTFVNISTLANSYDQIKVIYTATANEDVVIHNGTDGGNTNHAYLDYNNNPYGSGNAWKTDEDTVTVYSYGIEVKKTGEGGALLPGAAFTLRAKDGTSEIKFVETAEGTYRKATSDTEQNATTTLTVGGEGDMKGVLKLSGLDRGKYYLTETKAPAGYNKLGSPVEITIDDADTNGKPMDGENESSNGYVHITVVNTKGFNLPETGGMGTVLFTAGGILLMGAGVAVLALFVRRRGAAK